MNVLMYPIATDDDFPEMFCAIRQGSGEHWFYVPEGESASWMLFRAESENAKLRELVEDMHAALQAFCDAQDVHGDNCPLWVERTDDCELRGIERDMRELGIGVDG